MADNKVLVTVRYEKSTELLLEIKREIDRLQAKLERLLEDVPLEVDTGSKQE